MLAGSVAALAGGKATAAPSRNVVVIVIDDLLSLVYGRKRYGVRIEAPNLYRLMANSLNFTNAFASTALCNPSRSAIFSGRNPFKTGVHENADLWTDHIDPHQTFPGLMAAAGYRCFSYGKISHDNNEAWKTSGVCEDAVKPMARDDDKATVDLAKTRIRLDLRKNTTQPWLLMIGLVGPHAPHGQFPELLSKYPLSSINPVDWNGDEPPVLVLPHRRFLGQIEARGKTREYIQAYLADVTAMDRELGRLMAVLDTSGMDFTVILTSDHGYMLGDHDSMAKFTLWDEAGRAPLLVRYPGCTPRQVPQVVSLLDIAPTVLECASLPVPSGLDGLSLWPLINGTNRTEGAMTSMMDSVSFRDQRYRITRYEPSNELEFYDISSDPEEEVNLADDPAFAALQNRMLRKLDAKLARWKS